MSKNKCAHNFFFRFIAIVLTISILASLSSCHKKTGGFDGVRFTDTRHITVSVDCTFLSDSNNVEMDVSESLIAQYIHERVLAECNVDVKFVDYKSRNPQDCSASDIMFTSNINRINTYYRMNSIVNIKPYLDEYSSSFNDLIGLLGDQLYFFTDNDSEVWCISPSVFEPNTRVTFIRSDWLDILGLEKPSNREELYNCLVAFRDNADVLLGDDSSSMIPFFIDNEPGISAKPLFDSCYDVSISDKDFFVHGYCRATQDGYDEGLKILNDWYLEDLLPSDFTEIRPNTKESYEPIENGFVGAFCQEYDYLYVNGDNSHINALHENCGDEANYIAVNTFENSAGEYTYWQEDYLNDLGTCVYIPQICSDPLACLVYLNWISNVSNIVEVQNLSLSNPDKSDYYSSDRFLLTCNGRYPQGDMQYSPEADAARKVALDVKYISQGNKCVRCGPSYFAYFNTEIDYSSLYSDSTSIFTNTVICSPQGEFDDQYSKAYSDYLVKGAYLLCNIRDNQWTKVIENGNMTAW